MRLSIQTLQEPEVDQAEVDVNVVLDKTASSTNTEAKHLDHEYVEKDKIIKKKLVIDAVATHAKDLSSQNQVLADISSALEQKGDDGDELRAKIISGGYTNYSYKVYLRDRPDVAVFAKLSFPYALWNKDPDAYHDLIRTDNEHTVMKKISSLVEDHSPVATPFFVADVKQDDGDMKILCTEWTSRADEQFAMQWVDGKVDRRVLPKLAATLAETNCCEDQDFDDDFNNNIRECCYSVFPMLRTLFEELASSTDSTDRVAQLVKEMGKDTCLALVDDCESNFNERQVLIHSDSHSFNTLVEASADNSQEFGPDGALVLVDWEMAMVGPIGRDAGLALSWPVSCLLAHSLLGDENAKANISEAMDILWDEYAGVLRSKGKDEEFLRMTYRNSIAWLGWFVFFVHYSNRAQTEFLPVEYVSEADQSELFQSIGVASLKLFDLGFSTQGYYDDLTLDELREEMKLILAEESDFLDLIAKFKTRNPGESHCMSKLRLSAIDGRRVSDAKIYH